MVNAAESEKALRYIQQLDDARCAGRWKDVPELCRKVEKHASHRQCLTITARSEAQIAAYCTQRPLTDASSTSTGLSQVAPTLLSAIEGAGDHTQDGFQATVCLGWLHYVLEEPGMAVARLPDSSEAVANQMAGQEGSSSGWSRVCLVKSTFLRGSAQEKTGAMADAVTTYSSIIPWLSSLDATSSEPPQFKMWSEQLLVRLCQLSDQNDRTDDRISSTEALQTFRYWAKFWETAKGSGSDGAKSALHRRLAWKAYYDTLSSILQNDLPYEAEPILSTAEKSALQSQSNTRLRQRAELKRVETVYESLLIKETHFPKASESNQEIGVWIDSAIGNWRLLCGPAWTDHDVGEGGKEGVSRSVLDILYRAATKTYHSTQILRNLFIVHASLAEFDLAFKAYDSYVEIVTRGKDRVEQTGEPDESIDDDSTVLRTSAEAIRLLCRFGSRTEAEKAVDIGHHIENWLHQFEQTKLASDSGTTAAIETHVEPAALAVAYCAIGISQAHWAQFTYQADARAGIQAKAIRFLRKALSPTLKDSNNVDALYALAVMLAETRDIPAAIKTVKRALSSATKNETLLGTDGVLSRGMVTEFGRERKLIPLWHLLALLLTSRSEFNAAEKACEAAFAQFGDPTILFGSDDSSSYRSEHLKEVNGEDTQPRGIVDRMGDFEKSGILQIKMTQLALIEVTDGALAAVDGCDELLALYGRLFGVPVAAKAKLEVPGTLAPPKSSAGTIRGSIFRGRRGSSKVAERAPVVESSPQAGHAPAIQVTGDGNAYGHGHHILPHHKEGHSSVGRSSSKLRKRSASAQSRSVADTDHVPEVPPLPAGIVNGNTVSHDQSNRLSAASMQEHSHETGDMPLGSIPHNLPPTSPPQAHSTQPPRQDVRLPTPLPSADYIPADPYFSNVQERRQKVSLLVSIWIFISGLYTRAQVFNDAREAAAEALKLIETSEDELSVEASTAKALAQKGWGGGKSVDELWADALSARGDLLVAQSLKHDARVDFERALLHFPDHPQAIVGLSNILLDIYSQDIPMEPTRATEIAPNLPAATSSISNVKPDSKSQHLKSHTPSVENQLSPPELSRLAARDRASGLLSTLTKLGTGWDYTEAWYALARAYEESSQVDKAKEVLWWCVELEDTHPVRSWKNVALGGFVL